MQKLLTIFVVLIQYFNLFFMGYVMVLISKTSIILSLIMLSVIINYVQILTFNSKNES